jgi:hypothetical protein
MTLRLKPILEAKLKCNRCQSKNASIFRETHLVLNGTEETGFLLSSRATFVEDCEDLVMTLLRP